MKWLNWLISIPRITLPARGIFSFQPSIRKPPGLGPPVHPQDDDAENEDDKRVQAVVPEELADGDHDARGKREIEGRPLEDGEEPREDEGEEQDDETRDHADDRDRVVRRLPDRLAELLLPREEPVEVGERPVHVSRHLARPHDGDEDLRENLRVQRERPGKGRPGLDVAAYVPQHLAELGVGGLLGDVREADDQRDPRAEERLEVVGEVDQVGPLDLLPEERGSAALGYLPVGDQVHPHRRQLIPQGFLVRRRHRPACLAPVVVHRVVVVSGHLRSAAPLPRGWSSRASPWRPRPAASSSSPPTSPPRADPGCWPAS